MSMLSWLMGTWKTDSWKPNTWRGRKRVEFAITPGRTVIAEPDAAVRVVSIPAQKRAVRVYSSKLESTLI